MSGNQQEKLQSYWQKNVRLIRILIIIWAFVSLGMSVIFKPLVGNIVLPGFQIPISFWFAHQGAMIIFVILIFAYAYLMDKADSEYGVRE